MSKNIKGLSKLNAKLDKLATNKVYEQALGQAALVVEADAKKRVPVDTGMLRQSIHTQTQRNKLQATVGSPLNYAPYIEFGTGIHSTKGTGRQTPWSYKNAKGQWVTTLGNRPQPYLGPALRANRDKIQKKFEEVIRRELKK